jgi:hypothetical protein
LFKGTEANCIPVHYYNQKEAWMDREISENWFCKRFVPEVQAFLTYRGLPQNAVLLIDKAPSHPTKSVLTSDNSLTVVKLYSVFGTVFCESVTLVQWCLKLIPHLEDYLQGFPNEEISKSEILNMVCAMRSFENVDKDNIEEWLQSDACEQ